jgi:hypothetical protein
MGMNFNTSGHSVEEKEYVSAFMKPGIHTAKIQKIEYMKSNGGTEGIKITFEGAPMADLDGKGQTAETTLWLSAKAWPFTRDRLVIMADKLGVRDAFDAAGDADSTEAYAMAVNGVFAGKAGRWKFAGKEIEGKVGEDGQKKNNWVKSELAAFNFCEPLSVLDAESKLKFDENNKYDMQRLAPADVEADGGGDSFESTEESPW